MKMRRKSEITNKYIVYGNVILDKKERDYANIPVELRLIQPFSRDNKWLDRGWEIDQTGRDEQQTWHMWEWWQRYRLVR